jgi:hypothetical protein
MRRISMIVLLPVCTLVTLQAQNETHALRYSMHNPFGTARSAAQGGSIGALGGDLSAVQLNPAGLGFYRTSEFSFTPSFYWVNTSANFMGSTTGDSHLRFNVGSLGFVTAKNNNSHSGFNGFSFSMDYNTLVNFNNRTTIRADRAESSLLDDFTWHANANPDKLSPFYEQVAYDAYLLPYDSLAGDYWNDIRNGGYNQSMVRISEQSGYIGEYALAGAFNFSNLLYFGAAFGIHSVRFNEDIYHMESDPDGQILDFREFQFREFNSTRGWGYTFRFGLIVRPVQLFRVGASFQTPVYYHLTEEQYTDANSYWDSGTGWGDGYAQSPNGIYDYRLKTPLRAGAHASVILFKMATVSAGYEFVDYSTAHLEAYDDEFIDENIRIQQDLRVTHNVRAGAEVRLKSLYFRGGLQYLMSPYTDTRNDARQWVYSGGMGFRTKGTFFDVSYSLGNHSEVYGLYAKTPGVNEVSLNAVNASNLMVTLGFKF